MNTNDIPVPPFGKVNQKQNIFIETAALSLIICLAIYISFKNYLFFHSGIELFCVIVAYSIMVIAVNTFPLSGNSYFMFLGIAFIFVGFCDFLHTLAYKGMGVFPPGGSNLPTQIWIVSRYMAAISLLAAPAFLYRKINVKIVFFIYFAFTALLLTLVFRGFFPDCFIDGQGLTSFKKGSEYLISVIFLISLVVLVKNRDRFHPRVVRLLGASLAVTVASEIFFTFFTSLFSFSNMLGHILKFVSYYLIYMALVETSLKEPQKLLYYNLDRSNEHLQKNNLQLEHEMAMRIRTERKLKLANSGLAALNEKLESINQELMAANQELYETRDELVQKNQLIEEILNTAKVLIVGLDTGGRIILFNSHCEEITGCKPAEALGRDWFANFIPEYSRPAVRQVFAKVLENSNGNEYECEILTRHQGNRVIAWRNTVLKNSHGDITLVIGAGIDVTDRKKAEESMAKLASIVKHSNDAIVGKTLDGTIISWNTGAERIYGYTAEEVTGRPISILAPADRRDEIPRILELVKKGEIIEHYETARLRKDGSVINVDITVSPIIDSGGNITGASAITRNITARKRAEDLLKKFSYIDGLTGIANRRQFDETLEVEWKRAARNSSTLSLIMCDIDYFKKYNDTYGHLAGDDCLKRVAQAIKDSLKRPGDMVARYGGEEFAVILPNTDREGASNIAEVIRRNVANLNIPHSASEAGSFVTISLGVAALVPNTAALPPDSLVSMADRSLYNAKQSGRNRVVTAES